MSGQPSNVLTKALAAFQSGRLDEAERDFKKFLRLDSNHFGALNLYAALLMKSGRFEEAEPLLQRAISLNSKSDVTFYNYGLVLKRLNKFDAAFAAFSNAIAINPVSPETWNNRGAVLNDLHRPDEAVASFDKAISLAPAYAEAFYNKARSLFATRRSADAAAAYGEAIRLKPNFVEAWVGRAGVCFDLRDYPNALGNFEHALSLEPGNLQALLGSGFTYLKLKRYDDAEAVFRRVSKIEPSNALALVGQGHLMQALGRDDKAFESLAKAVNVAPEFAEALMYFGYCCVQMNKYDHALTSFEKALRIDPDLAGAWQGIGIVQGVTGNWATALSAYETAIKLKPNLDYLLGSRLHAAAQVCDWQGIEADWVNCIASIDAGLPVIDPVKLFSTPASAATQLMCATNYVNQYFPPRAVGARQPHKHDRIRIAYVSGDFRDHPVSLLLAGILEHHDRSRFQTIGISLSPESPSSIGQRIKHAFEEFHDVSNNSAADVAALLQHLEIDVAIDLAGHTQISRPGIFAHRAAPVQVNYLGYAGTMGTPYHDYIVADRIVIPEADHKSYSEHVAYLPGSFLPADDTRDISERTVSRAEAGLPDQGVVFCSFNNAYKITPPIFDVWMRLLSRAEGSVLWLSSLNESAQANLRREAEARGISPDRLVFAQRMENPEDHLARHRLADLFLDTIYYNAHTTASDALWAGLPIVTCIGSTFAGRVAASLLITAGLNELVTTSLEDYEALALKLARDPALLASIRAKLAANNRPASPLFNTERFTRHLEAAYTTMWQRAQNGEAPQSFAVRPMS